MVRGGIGEQPVDTSRCQIFHIDIGINDSIFPEAIEQELDSLAGFASFNWTVYAVETVVAEKLHTMVDRGWENSRSRDIFDIHLLLQQCDPDTLKSSVGVTFKHRKTAIPEFIGETLSSLDVSLLKRGWTKVMDLAPTAKSFDSIIDKLRELNL